MPLRFSAENLLILGLSLEPSLFNLAAANSGNKSPDLLDLVDFELGQRRMPALADSGVAPLIQHLAKLHLENLLERSG